jgi:hypothetical protein
MCETEYCISLGQNCNAALVKVKIKVKQSIYRLGQSLSVRGG